MENIAQLWFKQNSFFDSKNLSQIIGIIEDGKLRDENSTSKHFRDWLDVINSEYLTKYINNCLTEKFENSGYALQDIINQIGKRLEFDIQYGLYQGKKNAIGFDGIWTNKDGFSLVVEVKTTDTYRINLDSIANYRKRLSEEGKINHNKSSIIIVVGREDTGDLEAQIRGSKHAWDIRIISTESLLQLLRLKETFNDLKTINQINELLKPREFTRVDSLIQIIASTTEDLTELDSDIKDDELEPKVDEKKSKRKKDNPGKPANFHEECIKRVSEKIKLPLIKTGRVTYTDKEKTTGLICLVSKKYDPSSYQQYWYAFHPYQSEFLEKFKTGYVAFGCGTSDKILLVPYKEFADKLSFLNTTQRANSFYYHIHINEKGNKLSLLLHKKESNKEWDITKFLL